MRMGNYYSIFCAKTSASFRLRVLSCVKLPIVQGRGLMFPLQEVHSYYLKYV